MLLFFLQLRFEKNPLFIELRSDHSIAKSSKEIGFHKTPEGGGSPFYETFCIISSLTMKVSLTNDLVET